MSLRKKKQPSIVILICYMGQLPWYFEYFALSCRYNMSVDIVVITDDRRYSKPVPKNIRFIFLNLKEISENATERLGFHVQITRGYKLCDFKPAYAFLFPHLIQGYDFWGHGDLDVIYGDLRKFLPSDLLLSHDVISVRHDYVTGHFALFRNCESFNKLFMKSKDYQKVFMSERDYCFDETNYAFEDFSNNLPVEAIHSEIESMTHVIKRLSKQNKVRVHFDFLNIEGLPGKIKFTRGKLIYKNQFEVMMYHMIKLKKAYTGEARRKTIPHTFRISTRRIY